MRCKKHYTDLSSIVGVCASCLRERLFYLITTQSQPQSQTLTLEDDLNRNFDNNIPVFPRSVSPYITRRKSDTAASSSSSTSIQRFFSTPQLGPTFRDYNNNNIVNNNNNNNDNNDKKKKKKHSLIRFSLLSKLFRSRKQKDPESDSDPRGSSYGGGDSYHTSTSAMSSPFRLNTIRSSSRNKNPVYYSESSTTVKRNQYCSDRGMSPVRLSNCIEDEFHDVSSGYETCESRKTTPWRTPAHSTARRGGGVGGGGGGLMFCLSPLVRASPCRNWNQKGVLQTDVGDNRVPVKAHLSNAKSFCANRSRKLADFGRFNSNR